MNDSTANTSNTTIGLFVIIFLLLLAGAIYYFHSEHSMGATPVVTSTTTPQTASSSSEVTEPQSYSVPVTITNPAPAAYATYTLKDPNHLPITQYPKAYGVELDFITTGNKLPPNLCLKVAADVPLKAFSIPDHPNASTTIATTTYGGAFEGITCFSGGITSEEDTTVFFNEKPSEINAALSTSNVL